MIRACIFDLDGTLANTLESMSFAANTVLRRLGFQELPTDNFRYYCGDGAGVLVRRVLADAGDKDLHFLSEMEAAYRELFGKNPMYHVVPYDGIKEILEKFQLEGIKLAVCSNKPHEATEKVIFRFFGDAFDVVLGQKPGIARKPSPDGALWIADRLGVLPRECMYIGDTHTDMETGRAAGMRTVGALWGYRDEKELQEGGAETLAQRPEDLWKVYKAYGEEPGTALH